MIKSFYDKVISLAKRSSYQLRLKSVGLITNAGNTAIFEILCYNSGRAALHSTNFVT